MSQHALQNNPIHWPEYLKVHKQFKHENNTRIQALEYNQHMIKLKRPTITGYLVYSPMYRADPWTWEQEIKYTTGSNGLPAGIPYNPHFPKPTGRIETVQSTFSFMAARMSDRSINRYFIWSHLMKRNKDLPKYWSEILTLIP